ncbi:MAG TPA: neutral zinc metallopeptidase [Thermoanaerobaculia bacterium]|nr:neutral zinc metallopeptidase [Thermoanaerobaculia bacterium]
MRWRGARRSSNVEDRRGMGGPLIAGGGIGALVLTLLYVFLGGDPSAIQGTGAVGGGAPLTQADEEMGEFVSTVLGYTEDVWREQLPAQAGVAYQDPTLVLFSGLVQSACGTAQSASGPFYCPIDGKIYIDLSFYQQLRDQFGAPGDFAQAYVIAHEVGHHVQNLLGVSEQVYAARQRLSEGEGNELSVRQELQADCLAGVWAHHSERSSQILEEGDVAEAMRAASAIGDDRIQARTQGEVIPETFTHGTSEQRQQWFRRGLDTGRVEACDTFNATRI